ncbi:hypothetical protein ACGFIX_33870 [Nocardia salmonicida]|uniref:hypothetical protein n=1 Tax=Nocardia salmonicida TaxID=53431 RepID=UPI00371D4909
MSKTAFDPIESARQHYQAIWDQSCALWDLQDWFEYLMAPESAIENELGGGIGPVSELFLWPPILTSLDREELPLADIGLFAHLIQVRELVDLFNECRAGQWQHRPAELVARFTELTVTEQMQTLIDQSLLYSPEFQIAASKARALYVAEQARGRSDRSVWYRARAALSKAWQYVVKAVRAAVIRLRR